MTLVEPASPTSPPVTPTGTGTKAGILIVEGESTTPLGPRIAFANETATKLTGYDATSLIGSPIGLIYDRSDLNTLISKLPAIAQRPSYCWMNRMLVRNGGKREMFHWTIRPTHRDESPTRHFTLTISPLPSPKADPKPVPPEPVEGEKIETLPTKENRIAPIRSEVAAATEDQWIESKTESLALTAGGVAHDFKNALQTIQANLELAQLEAPPTNGVRAYLADAQSALSDAENLARQMLAFTKEKERPTKVFQVRDLLERVCRLCTAGTKIQSHLTIQEQTRPIEGDPSQIYQVFHNLVINARQAMPGGGILHLTAGNANLTEGNQFSISPGLYTVVSVKDRGCGIDAAALPHIFDPDFSTKKGGSGVGLASCRSIIERHGGAIRAASKIGVGTEFLVFLPSSSEPCSSGPLLLSEANNESMSDHSSRNGETGGGKILLVEDQDDVARATMGLLKHLGYQSVRVAKGEEAIVEYRAKLYSDTPFDVVLLDMTLPGGLNGEEVKNEIHKLEPEAIIVAMSGYFEKENSEEYQRSGFRGILPKPFSLDELSHCLKVAVGT